MIGCSVFWCRSPMDCAGKEKLCSARALCEAVVGGGGSHPTGQQSPSLPTVDLTGYRLAQLGRAAVRPKVNVSTQKRVARVPKHQSCTMPASQTSSYLRRTRV